MKRFIVIRNAFYYPGCGLHDLEADFDTLSEAKEYVANKPARKNEVVCVYDIRQPIEKLRFT